MDAAYQNALQRRARLRKELERLDIFVAMYEELSAPWAENASSETSDQRENGTEGYPQEVTPPVRTVDLLGAESRKARVAGNPKPRDVVRAVKDILSERGHPMTRRQLFLELSERGIEIKGSNPLKVLGTNLWRASEEIIALDRYGYWLRNQQYHPAGYYPDMPGPHAAA